MRWPTKPRPGERCDAHVGWHPDRYGQPVVERCTNEAVETCYVSETMRIQTYLCAEHAHLGFRNPRKFDNGQKNRV